MEIKSVNTRLREDQNAKEFGGSSSTLQRYRQNINMLPPYRVPPNSNKKSKSLQTQTMMMSS